MDTRPPVDGLILLVIVVVFLAGLLIGYAYRVTHEAEKRADPSRSPLRGKRLQRPSRTSNKTRF